jgi:hypothetical protein
MIHARGPVWHRKPQQQGISPAGLHGLDTDATWSYSKSDGWVYGHGTFCMVAWSELPVRDLSVDAQQRPRGETHVAGNG